MSADFPPLRSSLFAALGRKIFGWRLMVGLIVAVGGIEWLTPVPFFAPGHRVSQSLAILFAMAGLALRAWGSGCAGRHTTTAKIEAPRLVTGGPFAYLRNPIYAGTMCLGFGMAALIGDPRAYWLAALAFAFLYIGIVPAEEEFLRKQFGEAYAQYSAAVPRFLPRIRPWPGRIRQTFHWRAARGELATLCWAAGIYLALLGEDWFEKVVG
jgi:protein-S-isoprenylcysteine O-methyltransferase Ste14